MNILIIFATLFSTHMPVAQSMLDHASTSVIEVAEERVGDTSTYTLKKERFEVTFPGKPTEESQSVPTDLGDIEMYTYMYEVSPQEVWMLAYSDYPPEYVNEVDANDLLQGGKSGAMESLGITIAEEEKEVNVQKHPGLEFKATNGTYFVNYKMVMVGSRLYQVAILADGAYISKKKVKNFFKSFKVIF